LKNLPPNAPLKPIKRKELIKRLKELGFAGFAGPYSGGKHQYMTKGDLRLAIPNPHKTDISADLLMRILRQAGVSREEWDKT